MKTDDSVYVEDDWGWGLSVNLKDYIDGVKKGTYIDGLIEGATVPLDSHMEDQVEEILWEMKQEECAIYDTSDDAYDELRHAGEL